MFEPKYTISHRLLKNIKRVVGLVGELNQRRLPQVVLMELEQAAQALDFKRLIKLGVIERKGRGKASYYVLVDK